MAEKNSRQLVAFQFGKREVRTVIVDNEPWFVAKDVAEILGYSETAMMTRRLDEDEIRKIASAKMAGANTMARDFTIINESGLYNAILGSNKPDAKKFKKWVTAEVLPSIRKYGAYAVSPELLVDRLVASIHENERMKCQLEFAKNFLPSGNPGDLNRNGVPKNNFRRGYYTSGNGKSAVALIERIDQPGLFDEVPLLNLIN